MKKKPCPTFFHSLLSEGFSKTVLPLVAAIFLALAHSPLGAVFDPDQLNNKRFINIIFILDCSASMNKIIGPVRKIDIAKKTIETIIKNLAVESHDVGSMKTGLRVFGSKFYKWKQNCDDTSLEVPLNDIEITINPILTKVINVAAKGQSSLSLTIDALKGDFPEEEEESSFIVVVSDGDESCGGSPCVAVKQLVNSSRGISVNTLGVETDPTGYENLNCMAEAGNGLYFDSKDVDQFILLLKNTNRRIQQYRQMLASGTANDTNVIEMRDVTVNLTEYTLESASPLYPDRDERFPAIDTLRPEDKLFLISSRGLWIEVFAPEKQIQGWILAKTGGSEYSVTVADDTTPLYTEKSPSSEVITYLEAGTQLTVLKKEGAWYNVFSQQLNVRGWVIAFNVVEH
jgi:hypothetical protein